jgi:hypothetical protein
MTMRSHAVERLNPHTQLAQALTVESFDHGSIRSPFDKEHGAMHCQELTAVEAERTHDRVQGVEVTRIQRAEPHAKRLIPVYMGEAGTAQ